MLYYNCIGPSVWYLQSDLSIGPLCWCYCTIDHTHYNITQNQRHPGWFWHLSTLHGGFCRCHLLVISNCLIVIVYSWKPLSSQHNIKKNGQPELSEPSPTDSDQSEIGSIGARTNPRPAGQFPAQLWPRTLYLRVVPLNLLEASRSTLGKHKGDSPGHSRRLPPPHPSTHTSSSSSVNICCRKLSFWFTSHSTVVHATEIIP